MRSCLLVFRPALTLFAVLLAACAIPSSGQEEEAARDDRDGTPPDDARTEPIVGGSEATAYPAAAIVDMYQGGWQVASCSGAVIAPRIVMTAGHCAESDIDSWRIYAPYAGGQQASSHHALVYDWTGGSEFVNPNQHDISLLVLDQDITLTAYPKLASAAVAVGTPARNIGRIHDGVMSNTRLYVSQPLALKSGNNYGYPYDYVGSEIIESGDSGGPVVLDGSPTTIVAVNSGAGGGREVLARVDLLHDWIAAQIAAEGAPAPPPEQPPDSPPTDPCGGITWEGQCDGAVLSWCQDQSVHILDCGASARQCGWNGANAYYDCL